MQDVFKEDFKTHGEVETLIVELEKGDNQEALKLAKQLLHTLEKCFEYKQGAVWNPIETVPKDCTESIDLIEIRDQEQEGFTTYRRFQAKWMAVRVASGLFGSKLESGWSTNDGYSILRESYFSPQFWRYNFIPNKEQIQPLYDQGVIKRVSKKKWWK